MARLRTTLDELTAGAEPNVARPPATTAERRRRWMFPAVAAAAVVLVVGVGVAVVGRDDRGTPAAPTPTGAPVTPPPARAATIPWYGLAGSDGTISTPPIDVDPADSQVPQVWASPDYSRVLVATAVETTDASAAPDDWPVLEELTDVTSGVAWAFTGDDPAARWHGIYWAPDDSTSVVLTGFGFSPGALAELLPALQVEHGDAGPRVVSALSSLIPLPDGTPGFYTAPLILGEGPLTDGQGVSIAVSASGAARPLALWAPGARAITPTTTPFGPGIRIETEAVTHIWWRSEDGPFWAGLSAPPDQIDRLLERVIRVGDLATPAATSPPDSDGASPPPPTAPTSTAMAPAPGSTPPVSSSVATDASDRTAPPSTVAPMTMSTAPAGSEPAVTTIAPSTLPVGQRPPVAFGDSVMLSARASLEASGMTVVAETAVQASGIIELIRRSRAAEQLGRIVIVQVGTNGTITEQELDQMMAELPPQATPLVIVLTVHADRSWIAGNNELIRALPARYPNVKVVDWDQIATENPGILTSDGIHVEDRRAYADAIVQAYQG